MKNEKSLFEVESVMLNFFRRLTPNMTDKQVLAALKAASEQFNKSMKNPFEQQTTAYFNFNLWFQNKIAEWELKLRTSQ